MPVAPARLCPGGCGARVQHRGPCEVCRHRRGHQRRAGETWRRAPGAHGTLIDVYQTPRWKALRLEVLEAAHYLCQCDHCAKLPCPLPASTVDHKIPHRGDPGLLWSRDNLQAMNDVCHSRKTARELAEGRRDSRW